MGAVLVVACLFILVLSVMQAAQSFLMTQVTDVTTRSTIGRHCGLYAESAIRELLSRAPLLRYVAVLSEPDPGWTGRTGFVHAAVLQDIPCLAAFDIYAAGPPAMIETLRWEFARRGAAVDRLYCDSFDYAPDSRERQRSSASTKS